MSSIRAKRVIEAFINCVRNGAYTYDYAVTLIEDAGRYNYLSEDDKEVFYAVFEIADETEDAEMDEVMEDE